MALHTRGKIRCYGFPESYLPSIVNAIENGQVTWGIGSGFAEHYSAEFTWAGCKWGLLEFSEYVESVVLKEGNPTPEDISIAVLRG